MENENNDQSTKKLPEISAKPNQPNINFKKTAFAGIKRSFHYKYFLQYPWLDYKESEDKVYCFYCVLISATRCLLA